MKKSLVAVFVLACSLSFLQSALVAQTAPATSSQTVSDQDVALLRSDLRSQKKQIIAANMQLTDAQAEKFWPVYDQYTVETTKLGDTKVALIKEYADAYNTMTDVQADSLVKRLAALDVSVAQNRQHWIPNFRKVLTAKQTAMFFQLDRRIAMLMDLQLASMIPLVKQ